MMDTLPWWRSKVFVALLVTLLSHIGALFGKKLDTELLAQVVGDGLEIVSFLALLYAGWHRARSPVQPLTLTKTEEQKNEDVQ